LRSISISHSHHARRLLEGRYRSSPVLSCSERLFRVWCGRHLRYSHLEVQHLTNFCLELIFICFRLSIFIGYLLYLRQKADSDLAMEEFSHAILDQAD